MIDALVKSRFKHVKAFLWYGAGIVRSGAGYRLRDEFNIIPSRTPNVWLEAYGGSRWLFRHRDKILERQRLALRKPAER